MYDIGGYQTDFDSLNELFGKTNALLYVIDGTKPDRFEESIQYFKKIV